MKDASIIIASNKTNIDLFLSNTIKSIVNRPSKYNYEVIVVTPNDIKVNHDKVRVIKDYLNIGCSYAYNLGCHAAEGEMMTIMTDDWYYADHWEKIFDGLREFKSKYQIVGTIRTKIGEIPYSNILSLTKECLNSKLFGGNLFNPGMFHQYLEMDVTMLLHHVGQSISYADCNIGSIGEDKQAWHNKQRFFKADGIIFRKLWSDKLEEKVIPSYPLYEITYANEDEMNALVNYQMTIARHRP